MPPTRKKVDVTKSLPLEDMVVTSVELKPLEDEREKVQRLKKELHSFYVKDIGVFMLAGFFIVVTWFACLFVNMTDRFSPVEKDRAFTAFTAITSGAVGLLFGRQISK